MSSQEDTGLRKVVLMALVNCNQELNVLADKLSRLGWDSQELVILLPSHIEDVLNRYLRNGLSKTEIIKWANLIESRDDIGYDQHDEEAIKKVIFELANPEINGDVDEKSAKRLLRELRKDLR